MVEARAHGASTPQAIRFGTATTGGIITAAALIMIVVAGAFAFSDIVMMKYIAFGMIAALVIDATVIRMLLVPAVMYLLREDCWWAPKWVTALSKRIGHNERLEGFSHDSGPPTATAPVEPVTVGAASESPADVPRSGGAVISRSPIPEAHAVDDSADNADNADSYGAHSTSDDAIPFSELMRRLQEEQRPGNRER